MVGFISKKILLYSVFYCYSTMYMIPYIYGKHPWQGEVASQNLRPDAGTKETGGGANGYIRSFKPIVFRRLVSNCSACLYW